jgi:predicted transcriptional regulator
VLRRMRTLKDQLAMLELRSNVRSNVAEDEDDVRAHMNALKAAAAKAALQMRLIGVSATQEAAQDRSHVLIQRATTNFETMLEVAERRMTKLLNSMESLAATVAASQSKPESGVSKLAGKTAQSMCACLLTHRLPCPPARKELGASHLRILAALLTRTDKSWPQVSQKEIGEQAGLKLRRTQYVVDELVDHGWLSTQKVEGHENIYDLSALVKHLVKTMGELS